MPKVKIEKLVLDYNLYPRTEVDSVTVTDLVAAKESGADLPPVVVDKKSMRVADGFHRIAMCKRLKIDKIDVVYKDYASEAELYLDAVALNAKHGRKLSRYDQVRIITRAEELDISPIVIAESLNITINRAETLKIKKTAVSQKKIIPIKRTLGHLAGRQLSSRQTKGNEKAGGMRPLFYINQVGNLLENDLIDWEDGKLVEALKVLGRMINLRVAANKDMKCIHGLHPQTCDDCKGKEAANQ